MTIECKIWSDFHVFYFKCDLLEKCTHRVGCSPRSCLRLRRKLRVMELGTLTVNSHCVVVCWVVPPHLVVGLELLMCTAFCKYRDAVRSNRWWC